MVPIATGATPQLLKRLRLSSGNGTHNAEVEGRVPFSLPVYSVTKFAVRALSEGLRLVSKTLRVRVNSPGLTRSELADGIG